ncbi:MAG TPA: hypothetical protein VMT03_24095 [Polyangia bacterium]|nr:hypothetical protein [Polyangia bacterium]
MAGCTSSPPGRPENGGGGGGLAGSSGGGKGGGSASSTGGSSSGGSAGGDHGGVGGASLGGAGGGSAGTSGGGGSAAGGAGASGGVGASGGGGAAGGAGNSGIAGSTGAGGDAGTAGTSGGGGSAGGSGVAGSGGSNAGGNSGLGGAAGGGGSAASGPLVLSVTSDVDPVMPGGRALYTITVGNVSNAAIDGVQVVMQVPTGLSYYYGTDSVPNSAGCSTCGANSQPYWNLGTLPAGQTVTVMVNAAADTTLSEGSTISVPITLRATNVSPIMATKTIGVHANPTNQFSLGTETNPATAGQSLTLDLDIGQLGTTVLSNTQLTAYLPAGLTATAISNGGTQSTPGQIVWTIGQVGVGQLVHRTVDVKVDSSVPGGSLLTTRAVLAYDGGVELDGTAEYTVSVTSLAPALAFSITATPGPVVPGARVLYQMTVANPSTRPVDGVYVVFTVPTGVTFYYGTDTSPNSSGCSTCSANSLPYWSLGTMAPGTSETITVNALADSNIVGDGDLIRGHAIVEATNMNDVLASKTVGVHSAPSAQLAFGTVTNPVTPGQTFTLDVDIGQIGAAALTGTDARVHLPPGLTVASISDGGTQTSTGDVDWSIGQIAVAGYVHRSLNVTVDANQAPGTILRARADLFVDGGLELDSTSDYAVSVLAAAPPLSLAITATPSPVQPGARLLYTMTVTNSSARAVDGVYVIFRVPVPLSYYYGTDSDPDSAGCSTCGANAQPYWSLGTIAAGASQIITVNPQVATTALAGSLITGSTVLEATGLGAMVSVSTTIPVQQ